jgi:hypothetical protein
VGWAGLGVLAGYRPDQKKKVRRSGLCMDGEGEREFKVRVSDPTPEGEGGGEIHRVGGRRTQHGCRSGGGIMWLSGVWSRVCGVCWVLLGVWVGMRCIILTTYVTYSNSFT